MSVFLLPPVDSDMDLVTQLYCTIVSAFMHGKQYCKWLNLHIKIYWTQFAHWLWLLIFVAKCQFPLLSQNVTIEDYDHPAIKGNYITFGCSSSSLTLVGPSTSTCVGNGQWEPDPREAECRSTYMHACIKSIMMMLIINDCIIVTCDSPPPPPNGYIFNYSGTFEGAMVLFVCNNSYPSFAPDENYETAVCNLMGKWEPDPQDVCRKTTNSGSDSTCSAVI